MIVILLHALSLATTPLLSFSPFKILVLSAGLQHGWRRSLPLALTPLAADIPVIILVWLVLRQLPDDAIDLLRISGGLFFLYLATVLFRNARRMQKTPASPERVGAPLSRTFWQAVVAIWIAPQVYINWTVIGIPALLGYLQEAIWRGITFLLFFYALWIGGLAAQIVLFSQAGKINAQANNYIIMVASLFLVGFGVFQINLGIRALL